MDITALVESAASSGNVVVIMMFNILLDKVNVGDQALLYGYMQYLQIH